MVVSFGRGAMRLDLRRPPGIPRSTESAVPGSAATMRGDRPSVDRGRVLLDVPQVRRRVVPDAFALAVGELTAHLGWHARHE